MKRTKDEGRKTRDARVEVRMESAVRELSAVWVKRVVAGTLRAEKVSGRAVSVLVTGDRRIRALNRRFLGHDWATDTIAFPHGQKDSLGDVAVSADTARRTARELGISFREELGRYLVHGTLHLLGYDDHRPADRKRMHARQEAILRKILR